MTEGKRYAAPFHQSLTVNKERNGSFIIKNIFPENNKLQTGIVLGEIAMKKSLPKRLKPALAIAVLSIASTSSYAATAVAGIGGTAQWDNGITNIIGGGVTSLTKTNANSGNNTFTGNASLNNAAWGHLGSWYTFHTHMAKNILVSADSAGGNSPGITVWRTDGEFDGGQDGTGELSSASWNTPHSFNQVGAAGDYGTYWMTDNSVSTTAGVAGNTANGIVQTIGYANDGLAFADNAWGAAVGNDGVADGHAELSFTSSAHSWYLVFVGGGNAASTAAAIDLNVSAVPVPAAVYLFGSALIGLFTSSRRKITEA